MYKLAIVFLVLFIPTVVRGQVDEKKLSALAKARYDAAKKAYQQFVFINKIGQIDVASQYLLSKNLLRAQLDVEKGDPVPAYQAHFDRLKALKKTVKHWNLDEEKRYLVEVFVLEAELWLETAKTMGKPKKGR
jgi:hypothetical protein